jgi:hypothetical protein
MEFAKSVQNALKTLETALEQHEAQKIAFDRTISEIVVVLRNAPPTATVCLLNGCLR